MWANYSTDQKNLTGDKLNIKLEEKSYKLSFKAVPVKIRWPKNRQGGGGHNVPPTHTPGVVGLNLHLMGTIIDQKWYCMYL